MLKRKGMKMELLICMTIDPTKLGIIWEECYNIVKKYDNDVLIGIKYPENEFTKMSGINTTINHFVDQEGNVYGE
jgi:hypothetical protein